MLLKPGRQSKLGSGAKKRFQKPQKRMFAGTVVERESANAHVAVPMTPGGLGLLPSVRLAKATGFLAWGPQAEGCEDWIQ